MLHKKGYLSGETPTPGRVMEGPLWWLRAVMYSDLPDMTLLCTEYSFLFIMHYYLRLK
jgi:hypothetical protein